ncbi:MAG TPA: RNA methyltransferase [Polyangia bacterium]|nr:RNA methyltransferase [Polyangia bacterium]
MPTSFVTDPADSRLDDYRDLQDRRLNEEGSRFVAESELVVRELLQSGLRVHSVLLTAPRLSALEEVLGEANVLVAPQEILDNVTGFHIHRGCLAIGERPAAAELPAPARALVVLEDLVDVDNLGAMARNAAALGADAIVLSPRCADPFYRKAIRVSMGAVFRMPIVRAAVWPEDLRGLRASGFTLVAAVLDADAVPIERYAPPEKFALVLGSEGPGLSEETKQLCDARVTIPMRAADSLNVATAGAVLLHHLLS